MTREELNKKKVLLSLNNKKYEKVAHSGTENFLAYRKKVLEGRAKMDALKRQSEMFNVTEANDKHYNDLVNTGMLIHAQNPLYGQQRDNTKYYKREGEPGKYRYYYTKEEYDAAHRTGASSDAEREAKARQQYETNKKIENYKNQNKQETGEAKELGKYEYNQAMNAEIKKFSDIAREGGAAAASKKMVDEGYADDLLYVVKKGLQSGKLTYKDGRFETDDAQLRADIDEESSFLQKRSREVGELSGKGKDIQKELEKLIISEIENLNNENEERKEISKKNDAGREAAIKKGQEAEQKRQAKEDFNKKLNETITNEGSDATADYIINNSPEWKEMVQAYKQAVNDGYIKMYRDGGKTVKNKGSKEIRDKFDPIFEKFEAVMQEAAKNPDFDRKGVEKLLNNELNNVIIEATENKYGVRDNTKKLAHEDSDLNTITTSEPLTPEQEYLNFKTKVEAGMKKQETIRHSMFIKSAKKQEAPKPIKPVYDNNKFDFYENVKKFKEEHPNTLMHADKKELAEEEKKQVLELEMEKKAE